MYSDTPPGRSGQPLGRCKKLVLGQLSTEVSERTAVLLPVILWQGTSPPCRHPRAASTRVDSGIEQNQPIDQTIVTSARIVRCLGIVMTAEGILTCSRRNLGRNEVRCSAVGQHMRWA